MIRDYIQGLNFRNDRKSWFILIFFSLAFQLFYPPKVVMILVLALLAIGVFNSVKGFEPFFTKEKLKLLFPLLLMTGLYFGHYPFSENMAEAWFKIEKKGLFLFLPLIICCSSYKMNKAQMKLVLILFCLSALLFFSIAHVQFINMVLESVDVGMYTDFSSYFSHPNFEYNYRIWLGDLWHIHPTYLGLIIDMSILIGLGFLVQKKNPTAVKVLGVFSVVIGGGFLLLIASRMAILSLICVGVLIGVVALKKYRLPVLFVGVSMFIGLTFFLAKTNSRVKEVFETKMELPTVENFNSVNIRVGIYSCATDLLKNNWLLGHSPGDVEDELYACYDSKKMTFISDRGYNTHNEFMNQLLGFGCLGVVWLLWLLVVAFKRAFESENYLFIGFLVLFTMTCLTENVLERHHGTMFFSFFFSLFMFLEPLKEDREA